MSDRRPRILFAWELGDNFGHAAKIAEVVAAIGDSADIDVAVKYPAAFRAIAPDAPVRLLPAPAGQPPTQAEEPERGVSYSDNLRFVGWRNADALAALIESWANLIDMTRPDALVCQATPTALLAARGSGLPTAMLGSGYDAPPRAEPMPTLYHWQADAAALRLAREREARTVATANLALAKMKRPPLRAFKDLLQTDRYLLATFPEIDCYRPRATFEPDHPPYLGQLFTESAGVDVAWRAGAERRLIAYLRPGFRQTDAALAAFARLGPSWDVVVAMPGGGAALQKRLAPTGVRLIDGPVKFGPLLPEADLAVSHASNGSAAAFAYAGVPQLMLPSQSEQVMTARAAGEAGLGLGLHGRVTPEAVAEAIRRILASDRIRDTVDGVAKRLTGAGPKAAAKAAAREILSLVL